VALASEMSHSKESLRVVRRNHLWGVQEKAALVIISEATTILMSILRLREREHRSLLSAYATAGSRRSLLDNRV